MVANYLTPMDRGMLDAVNRFQSVSTRSAVRLAGGTSMANNGRYGQRLRSLGKRGLVTLNGAGDGALGSAFFWGPTSKTSRAIDSPLQYSKVDVRAHTVMLSSIAGQLMQCALAYDEDVLKVGSPNNDYLHLDKQSCFAVDEWERLREEILNGDADLIAEHEYRPVWGKVMKLIEQTANDEVKRNQYTTPERELFTARERLISGYLKRCAEQPISEPSGAYEAWSSIPEERSYNDYWRWVLMNKDYWFDTRAHRFLDWHGYEQAVGMNPDIERELIRLADHCVDMVIARPGGSIAIELERTAKDVRAYERTMLGFCTPQAEVTYSACIWIVTTSTTRAKLEEARSKVQEWLANWSGGGAPFFVPQVILDAHLKDGKSYATGADVVIGSLMNRGAVNANRRRRIAQNRKRSASIRRSLSAKKQAQRDAETAQRYTPRRPGGAPIRVEEYEENRRIEAEKTARVTGNTNTSHARPVRPTGTETQRSAGNRPTPTMPVDVQVRDDSPVDALDAMDGNIFNTPQPQQTARPVEPVEGERRFRRIVRQPQGTARRREAQPVNDGIPVAFHTMQRSTTNTNRNNAVPVAPARPVPTPDTNTNVNAQTGAANGEANGSGFNYVRAAQEAEHLPAPGESFLD
ncbi:hypothetical protein [Bifidobacterium olomucense]|uniref:Uncharacterized protein n=1 Tax=Bifidobacterium olomucense TaxID=2675324 RepID=A0A7Y0EWA8_9BIFI|nr:hypothetical protein [Bifidobacterium sp. DSM 109959]NMM97509.1 hypothetical protein [Bifidobacterium sp. DSM 109959]